MNDASSSKSMDNPATTLSSFDPTFPQQAYQELATCPYTTPDGRKVLGRRSDIVAFTRHPAVRQTDGIHFPLGAEGPLIPLALDGDEHRRYRALLEPLFAPKAVEVLKSTVRNLVDGLVDSFIADGSVELYGTFCEALPSAIFVELLGLPTEDLPQFLRFKHAVVRPDGDTDEERLAFALRAGQEMTIYLNRILDEREASAEPRADLIGGLLTASVDGQTLTRVEILNIVYLLVIAGLDTVASSLSCMIAWLAEHPEERARLVADPTGWPQAVEELLRFESPVMYGRRYVAEDLSLGDWNFTAGEWVDVVWAAANVDPEAFDEPLKVDLARRRNAHIDFASGPHRCLGSNLARMELVTVLEQFHRRIPDYEVTPGQRLSFSSVGVRMAAPLPLTFPA